MEEKQGHDLLQSIAGNKPLAIVLAGHNGSGESTLWYDNLVRALRIPLINADRLSLLHGSPRNPLRKAFSAMHIRIARLLHLFQ
jgi:predicted ABC-type ATPase